MKYINNYSTLEEANKGVNFSPNVSLIENQLVLTDVGEDKPIEFKKTGDKITGDEIYNELTFKGKDAQNSVQLKWTVSLGSPSVPSIDMEVSINDGDWRPYEITDGTGEIISLSANDTVKFRGDNETLGNSDYPNIGYWQFAMTGIIEAHGNIMSLLDKTYTRTDVPEHAFEFLFQGCTSLTTAPKLPAITLAKYCYNRLFAGCTSLTTAPKLPAITLAPSCYYYMFNGCTSLTTAPDLHAHILPEYCYSNLFNGCISLTVLTVHADDISSNDCIAGWLVNTAQGTTGTLHSLGSADFIGNKNIPENWTISTTPSEF